MDEKQRYLAPGWLTRHVMNPVMAGLTRIGLSVHGSTELRVRGRSSGEWRSTPVFPLTLGGQRYLIAPRGTTQWVRNLRAAQGVGELRVGRRTEGFMASELADDAKGPILRAYVVKWKAEVGQFFPNLPKKPTDQDLAAIAADFPVFRITAS